MSDIVEYSSENLSSHLKLECNKKTDKYFMYMTKEELMKYFTR